jgi:hypothetical protein
MVVRPGSARAQQTVWEEVGSPDGRYRLKIPKGYRYLQVPAHGGVLHSYVIMLPDKFTLELLDVAFTSPQPNIPTTAAGLQFALDQTQGGMQKSWPDSTVLEQRPVTAGAVAGREVALATDRGSRVVIARLYLTPVAIYMQIAQGPAAERRNPVIAQFMDSLRLG